MATCKLFEFAKLIWLRSLERCLRAGYGVLGLGVSTGRGEMEEEVLQKIRVLGLPISIGRPL